MKWFLCETCCDFGPEYTPVVHWEKVLLQLRSNVNKKDIIKALAKTVGREDVLTSTPDLIAYSYDATGKRFLPDVVVFPESTAEVSAIMKIAHRERLPVVA